MFLYSEILGNLASIATIVCCVYTVKNYRAHNKKDSSKPPKHSDES